MVTLKPVDYRAATASAGACYLCGRPLVGGEFLPSLKHEDCVDAAYRAGLRQGYADCVNGRTKRITP